MEGLGWIIGTLFPRESGIPLSLLFLLLAYSFSSQFLPIEPYLVPYLTSVKKFTNYQVTIDIYPYSVYAQLLFTFLIAPLCIYLSHKVVIVLGALGVLMTYIIVWCGKSLLSMQIMQVLYGFGMASRLVFTSYIFLLVPEEDYQATISVTTTASLLSFMLASELSQFLALQEASYTVFFVVSLVSLVFCCITTFLLPTYPQISSSLYPSLAAYWSRDIGWLRIFHETWHGRSLQILSLWWALSYAGVSLVQNYGTNLFDAIDSSSKLNGHVLAASQAAGSVGAFCAIYLENMVRAAGLLVYMLGSAIMGMLCVIMGSVQEIWVAYTGYVVLSGIYQSLTCLASVRCSRLLSNRQFILLFSINNFIGLLIETLLQAALEVSGLSISKQFITYSVFLFLATSIVAVCTSIGCIKQRPPASVSTKEPLDLETDPDCEKLIGFEC